MTDQGFEKINARIRHIESHLNGGFNVDLLAKNIIDKKIPNPGPRYLALSSHALASAMSSWFGRHKLDEFRQWCYVAARLGHEYYNLKKDVLSPGGKFLQLLMPLCSNNETVINKFADLDTIYNIDLINNNKTHDFYAFQGLVALRKDWPLLVARSQSVLENLPEKHREHKYLLDHRFYLALGHGDVSGMEDALCGLTDPKVVRSRANDESGYTEDLIFTPAVILAKIAWRSGYQVKVDSSLVPAEWLPMDPLPHYDNHYDFLK